MTKKQIFQCAWQMYKQKYTTPQPNRYKIFGECLSRVHESYTKERKEAELKRLIAIMCNGVANFSYLKKDGTIRNAIGTLDATKIPSDKLPTTGKAKNDSVQTYYELGDVNNFRCFIKQNLISIN